MAGGGFEQGLSRVSKKESNNYPQGRSGGKVPIKRLTGDSNPTKGGGINRSTSKASVTR